MSPVKRKQIDPIEKAIEATLPPGRFISYNAAWSFLEDVQGVADDIGKIIRKEPARAARLYEIFIAACHEKADEIDDSSGNFGMLVEELFQGWIKARQGANFDPDETAISLISWMEDDPYGFCHDLERGVVKVFDKKGAAAFYRTIQSVRENGMDMTGWVEYFVKGLTTHLVGVRDRGEQAIRRDLRVKAHRLSGRQGKASPTSWNMAA